MQEAAQYSIENILTENNQLEKDNAMMKTELDNRKDDFAKQEKMGGDKKVNLYFCCIKSRILPLVKTI